MLIMNDWLDVEIIEIKDANKYILRKIDSKAKFNEIVAEMNLTFSDINFKINIKDKINEKSKVFAVKFKNNWYRAKVFVNDLYSQQNINAYLIDVGKCEIVLVQNLRDLPVHLQETEPLVKICQLFGILPITKELYNKSNLQYDEMALKFISNLINVYTKCRAKIIHEIYGQAFIQLHYFDEENNKWICVNDILVEQNFAKYDETLINSKKVIKDEQSIEFNSQNILQKNSLDNVQNQSKKYYDKLSDDDDMSDGDSMQINNYSYKELVRKDKFIPNNRLIYQSNNLVTLIDDAGILLDNIPDIKFTKNINQLPFIFNMSTKLLEPLNKDSLLETYMWQLVETSRNILCVAPSFNISKFFGGKTYGYFLPLVHNLVSNDKYSNYIPKYRTSPFIVIICCYSSFVEKLGKQLKDIASVFKLDLVYIFPSLDQLETETKVINGCDILITTMESLFSLIDRKIIHLKHICHLVFEEFRTMLMFSKLNVERLLSDFALILKNRSTQIPQQIIIVSSKWTPELEDFKERLNAICIIASRKECTYSSRVKHMPIMCASRNKENKIKEILGDHQNVLICTNDTDSSMQLSYILKLHKVNYLMISDDITIKYSKEDLESYDCIIIGDDVENLIGQINSRCMVHWDLPQSATKFFNRIWILRDYFWSKKTEESDEIFSIILINEETHNKSICQHINKILLRANVEIPLCLMKLGEQEANLKMETNNLQLCDNLKSFGLCRIENCLARHTVYESIDFSSKFLWKIIPNSGKIKVRILKVKSPATYFVEILWHQSAKDKSVKEFISRKQLIIDINFFYQSYEGKLYLQNVIQPQEKKIFALKNLKSNIYERIQILSINKLLEQAKVYFIDSGTEVNNISIHDIVNLPQHFIDIPYQAIEICICRLQLPDNDISWTKMATEFVENLLYQKELVGEIIFKLGNILWLDPLEEHIKLRYLNIWNKKMNVREVILQNRLAVENPKHLDNLKQACNLNSFENVIKIGKTINVPCSIKGKIMKVNYEKFPDNLNKNEYHKIFVIGCTNINEVYVQLEKNTEEIIKFDDEIQKFVLANKLEKLGNLKFNSLVLAKDKNDNRWYRSQIIEYTDDKIVVFFLDYGEFKHIEFCNILPLPQQFLHFPFQAIRCHLSDIEFPMGIHQTVNSEEVIQFILDMTGMPNGGIPDIVYSKVIDEDYCVKSDSYQYTIRIIRQNPIGYFEDLAMLLVKNDMAQLTTTKIERIVESTEFAEDIKSDVYELFHKLKEAKFNKYHSQMLLTISTNLSEKNISVGKLVPVLMALMKITNDSELLNSILDILLICIKQDSYHCNYIRNPDMHSSIFNFIHQEFIWNGNTLAVLNKIESILKCFRCASYIMDDDGIYCMINLINLVLQSLSTGFHTKIINKMLGMIILQMKFSNKRCKYIIHLQEILFKCLNLDDKEIALNLLEFIRIFIHLDSLFLTKFSNMNGLTNIFHKSSYWSNQEIIRDTLSLFVQLSQNIYCCIELKKIKKENLISKCFENQSNINEDILIIIDQIYDNIDKLKSESLNNSINISPIIENNNGIQFNKHPQLKWCNDDAVIFIRINVQDVLEKNCFLNLQSTNISFRAIVNTTEYSFDFNLFDEIITQKSKMTIKCNEVHLKLAKANKDNIWLRLTKIKNEYRFIETDFDSIPYEENDDTNKIPCKINQTKDIGFYTIESESSTDEDEDKHYIDAYKFDRY